MQTKICFCFFIVFVGIDVVVVVAYVCWFVSFITVHLSVHKKNSTVVIDQRSPIKEFSIGFCFNKINLMCDVS